MIRKENGREKIFMIMLWMSMKDRKGEERKYSEKNQLN